MKTKKQAPQLLMNFEPAAAPEEVASVPTPAPRYGQPDEAEHSDLALVPVTCGGSDEGRRMAAEILKIVERTYDRSTGYGYDGTFRTFIEIVELALGLDEEAYLAKVKSVDRAVLEGAVEVYKILSRMWFDHVVSDVLGFTYMEISSKWKAAGLGQYFTPPDLCEAIAQMTLGTDIREQVIAARAECRKIKICDPACGSGAMLLAAKRVILSQVGYVGLNQFGFYGQDIDRLCVSMCRVQLMLTDYRYMRDRLIVAAGDVRSWREAQCQQSQ